MPMTSPPASPMPASPSPAPVDVDAAFRQLAAVKEALATVDFPPWHTWRGTDLLEYWLGLRYPLKLARVINRIYSGEATRIIMAGPRGGGKCLSLATTVRMHDGRVKAAQDVVVGDSLMGPKLMGPGFRELVCQPRRVLSTTRGAGPLFAVESDQAARYVVNEHHILSFRWRGRLPLYLPQPPTEHQPQHPAEHQPEDSAAPMAGRHHVLEQVVNLPVTTYLGLPESVRADLRGWRSGGTGPRTFPVVVTPHGHGEYAGWETDVDHLFLLEDFTVTHNSMQNAALEFLLWAFLDFDVVNIGGSEQQAGNVYAYLQGFTSQYREAAREWNLGGRVAPVTLLKETMVRTVRRVDPLKLHRPTFFEANTEEYEFTGTPLAKDSQAFIAVLAASPKQVRGPHAGSERRGGLLVVDEEAEVAAEIYNAAKYTVNTARPSIILRTSTYHNAVGTFAEDFENPEAKGFERHRFSIFDVARACPTAVTTAAQWADLRAGQRRIPGDDDKSVRHLPVLQPDCSACPHPEYFRDGRPGVLTESGESKGAREPWCAGAAAFAENGWMTWVEIEKLFVERPNDEDFEVELLGFRPSSFGLVVTDREGLNACVADDELCAYLPPERRDASGFVIGRNEGAGECITTIDWGLSGVCAALTVQNRYDLNPPYGCRVVIEAVDLGHMADTLVYDHCDEMNRLYGANEVWADASHPYQNRNLAARGFDVHIVYFAKMKELGVGSINAHVARRAFRFPREMARTLIEQLRGWRRDKGGKVVKGNDHFPDSLLCSAVKYLDMVNYVFQPDGGGPARRAGLVNQVATAKEGAQDERSLGRGLGRGSQGYDGSPGYDASPGYNAPTARDVARTSAYTGDRPHALDPYTLDPYARPGQQPELPPPPEPREGATATERIIADAARAAQAMPRRFR